MYQLQRIALLMGLAAISIFVGSQYLPGMFDSIESLYADTMRYPQWGYWRKTSCVASLEIRRGICRIDMPEEHDDGTTYRYLGTVKCNELVRSRLPC